jgi:hypothetical protein
MATPAGPVQVPYRSSTPERSMRARLLLVIGHCGAADENNSTAGGPKRLHSN